MPKLKLAADRVKPGAMPVPVRLTDCALPAVPLLLSVTVRVPARLPAAVGLKVKLIVQLPPTATAAEQALVAAKSPALAPETATALTVSAAVPVLVTVTVCAGLVLPTSCPANAAGVERPATGAVPVPFRLTVSVLEALPDPELFESLMVNVPLRDPVAVGLKPTVTVQVAEAAKLVPQVFVSLKSPVAARLVMLSPTVPVFVRVTFWLAPLVLSN